MSKTGDIIRALREGQNLSQAALAKKVGVSQATIDKIERGESTRTRFLSEIATALGVSVDGLKAGGKVVIPQPNQRNFSSQGSLPSGREDLPIYASAQGGQGEIIINYDPIDYVQRPSPLENVKGGYAMYIVGDSMAPAFEQGDLVLVNPHLPYKANDDVLIFKDHDHEHAAVVKRLVKATADLWHLKQFNPDKTFTLSRKEWPKWQVIVGKYSRR